jgi:hypothetical protein
LPIPPARIALVYRERLTRMLECDAAIEALEGTPRQSVGDLQNR